MFDVRFQMGFASDIEQLEKDKTASKQLKDENCHLKKQNDDYQVKLRNMARQFDDETALKQSLQRQIQQLTSKILLIVNNRKVMFIY